jgi:U3 small nucleolar RNA-associated protein 21
MSQLFDSFRAIGFVCDDVPAAVQQRGTETFIAVAVGRSYQLFSCDKLNLLFAGPMLRQRIRALAQLGDLTFAASGPDVFVYRRGKQSAVYRDPTESGRVALLQVLGVHLLAIRRSGQVTVWDTAEGTPWRSFRVSRTLGEPTVCVHPPTYLNKVLIGGSTGAMELWNVRAQKVVYSFKGWGSAITALQPSPAVRYALRSLSVSVLDKTDVGVAWQVDLVAVGLADGRIVLHNVLTDSTLCTFQHDAAISALAFRTDGTAWLLSGDAAGCVAAWDLDQRRIHCMNKAAHGMAITTMVRAACSPCFLSSAGALTPHLRRAVLPGKPAHSSDRLAR